MLDETLSDISDLYDSWLYAPPANRLLAIHLQATTTWKPKKKQQPFRESTLEEVASMFGAALAKN